jgi:hypothetical protein
MHERSGEISIDVAERIAKLTTSLGDKNSNEALTAARAIASTLKTAGPTFTTSPD